MKKRLLTFLVTIALICGTAFNVGCADGWGDLFSNLAGLMDTLSDTEKGTDDEEDIDALSMFQDIFIGSMVEVEVGGKKMKIHESFKLAMDEYEEFYDLYIEIMTDPNPDLMEYAGILLKASEMEEALNQIDEHDMSEAEELYMTAVLLRIDEKLLSAEINMK